MLPALLLPILRERLEEVLARQKEAATAAEEVAGRRKEAEDRRREELAMKMAAKAQRKQQAQVRALAGYAGLNLYCWVQAGYAGHNPYCRVLAGQFAVHYASEVVALGLPTIAHCISQNCPSSLLLPCGFVVLLPT